MTETPHGKHKVASINLLLGIWCHLSQRRHFQLGALFLVMLVSGAVELVSLGAVFPFLEVLTSPERLWKEPLVMNFAVMFGLTSATQLIMPVTIIFVVSIIVASGVRVLNLWLNGRLAAAIGSDLSCDAFTTTLYQPYILHLQRNSSQVIATITNQIARTVAAINCLLQFTLSAVVALGLFGGLLLINLKVAISAGCLFGIIYFLLAIASQHQLQVNSRLIALNTSRQLKSLQEGLGAIRDVILDGTQQFYLALYRQSDRPQRQLSADNIFLGAFPRYALEAVGMVAIALLGAFFVWQESSPAAVVALLGTLALGAQRLLPALQQVYSNWALVNGFNADLEGVLELLSQPYPINLSSVHPFNFSRLIQFIDVRFRYDSSSSEVLRGLNLQIYRGQRIGLIGSTGSGKSTTLDLVMGLLSPTSGQMLVDGFEIHDPLYPDRIAAWRAAIAHVPQSIYLADSSIAENIAFGVPRDQIDRDLVIQAAEQAQISGFINGSPDQYDTFVGERGVRLSGGQRQRIGIARALYKKAQILVFDEATSALDTDTETAVMQAIDSLSRDLTIIVVAHRLSTLHCCDRIIRLDDGAVVDDCSSSRFFAEDRSH